MSTKVFGADWARASLATSPEANAKRPTPTAPVPIMLRRVMFRAVIMYSPTSGSINTVDDFKGYTAGRSMERGRYIGIECRLLCQTRTSARLFDHLVGTGKHGLRYRQTQPLRRLEIDNKFVLGRSLYRQTCGFLAFENAVDVNCRTPPPASWSPQFAAAVVAGDTALCGETINRFSGGTRRRSISSIA